MIILVCLLLESWRTFQTPHKTSSLIHGMSRWRIAWYLPHSELFICAVPSIAARRLQSCLANSASILHGWSKQAVLHITRVQACLVAFLHWLCSAMLSCFMIWYTRITAEGMVSHPSEDLQDLDLDLDLDLQDLENFYSARRLKLNLFDAYYSIFVLIIPFVFLASRG